MIKYLSMKYLYSLLLIPCVIFSFNYTTSSNHEQISVQNALEMVLALPETAALWKEIQSEGPVRVIAVSSPFQFEAVWEGEARVILVNLGMARSKASIISSILFEMQNAKGNRKLTSLYSAARWNQMSLDQFATEIEQFEYENLINAERLLKQGQGRGIYPRECFLPHFVNFSDYLHTQEITGHTAYHRDTYKALQQS